MSSSFQTLLLCTLLISLTLSYTVKDYEIYDLESTTSSLSTEAVAWTVSPLGENSPAKIWNCYSVYTLGGYHVLANLGYFNRTYTGVPAHNSILLLMDFYVTDRMEPQDYIFLTISDGTTNYLEGQVLKMNPSQTNWATSTCGSGDKDLPGVTLMTKVSHTGSTLFISVYNYISNNNPNRASIGIRNVQITFSANTVASTLACGIAPLDSLQGGFDCGCTTPSEYKNPLNQCVSCDPACKACLGAGPESCTACATGYIYDGTKCVPCDPSCQTCSGTNYDQCLACPALSYVMLNTYCTATCTSPYTITTPGGVQTCEAACGGGSYAYTNGSCSASCPIPYFKPLTQNSNNYCMFACNSTDYYDWLGECRQNCDSIYRSRNEGGYHYCDYPCSSSEFLYLWNGTCSSECHLPLITITDATSAQFCKKPCTNDALFSYWDNSCKAACPFPLTSETQYSVKVCYSHCAASGDFLYYDGTCASTCPLPLVSSTSGSVKFCNRPCDASEYLFWNSSCKATCPSPLSVSVSQNVKKCDYTCTLAEFLYFNKTCLTSCSTPFVTRVEASRNYCDYPCKNLNQFIFEDNVTCLDSCPFPLISTVLDGAKYCARPCSSPDFFYYPEKGTCSASCPYQSSQQQYYKTCQQNDQDSLGHAREITATISSAALLTVSILSVGSPSGVLMGLLSKLLSYIKFLSVTYSVQLEKLLANWDSNLITLDYDPSPVSTIENDSYYHDAPDIFAKRGTHPSFLANQWNEILPLAIMAAVYGLVAYIERFPVKTTRKLSAYYFIHNARLILQNLVLVILYTAFGDSLFFILLDWRTNRFNSALARFNFTVSLICFIGGPVIFILHFIYLKRHHKQEKQVKVLNLDTRPKQHLDEGLQILYRDFKDESLIEHSFLLIFMIRDTLFNFILAVFFDYPMAQVVIFIVINAVMIIYLRLRKPLKEFLDAVQQAISEGMLMLVNICILVMAALDREGKSAVNARIHLCRFIIVINILFNIMVIIFAGYKIYQASKGYYLQIKALYRRRQQSLAAKKNKIWPISPKESLAPQTKTKLALEFVSDSDIEQSKISLPQTLSEIKSLKKINALRTNKSSLLNLAASSKDLLISRGDSSSPYNAEETFKFSHSGLLAKDGEPGKSAGTSFIRPNSSSSSSPQKDGDTEDKSMVVVPIDSERMNKSSVSSIMVVKDEEVKKGPFSSSFLRSNEDKGQISSSVFRVDEDRKSIFSKNHQLKKVFTKND